MVIGILSLLLIGVAPYAAGVLALLGVGFALWGVRFVRTVARPGFGKPAMWPVAAGFATTGVTLLVVGIRVGLELYVELL